MVTSGLSVTNSAWILSWGSEVLVMQASLLSLVIRVQRRQGLGISTFANRTTTNSSNSFSLVLFLRNSVIFSGGRSNQSRWYLMAPRYRHALGGAREGLSCSWFIVACPALSCQVRQWDHKLSK